MSTLDYLIILPLPVMMMEETTCQLSHFREYTETMDLVSEMISLITSSDPSSQSVLEHNATKLAKIVCLSYSNSII